MVQVAWQSESVSVDSSSALIPRMTNGLLTDDTQVLSGLSSWELTSLSLPGCLLCIAFPRTSHLIASFYRLLLGTLYPAYSSYKAIRAKDNKEYITWMMYWVVFALFTSAETITDIFFSFWFPFYYELKIIVVLWLLSPATQGSSILYRKFVHPVLVQREQEIDDYLLRAKEESVKTVMELGTRGVQYASRIIMQTAINGGGGLMSTLRRSYSVGDVSDGANQQVIRRQAVGAVTLQPLDERTETRPASRNRQPSRQAAASVNTATHVSLQDVSDSEMSFEEFDEFDEMGEEPALQELLMRPPTKRAPRATTVTREIYFTEIDSFPRIKQEANEAERYIGEIRSVEDVSSGYSSTEVLAADETGTVTVTRRGTRAASSRPVTMVDGASNAASKNHGTDVPSYATLPRNTTKKRTTKNSSTSISGRN